MRRFGRRFSNVSNSITKSGVGIWLTVRLGGLPRPSAIQLVLIQLLQPPPDDLETGGWRIIDLQDQFSQTKPLFRAADQPLPVLRASRRLHKSHS